MLSSLVVGGPGFIGGGASGEDAAIWTSSDGLAWTRTAGAPSGPGRVNGLAAGGPGFVAVGGMRGAAGGRGAAWTSADGVTWSAVPDSPAFASADGSGYAEMMAVVHAAPGFVAVGVGGLGAAWTSPDGISWRRATLTDPGAEMRDVAVGGPGLVAVGRGFGVGEMPRAAIWTSPDGSLWTRVDDAPLFENAMISAVVARPGGLIAVGSAMEPATGALRPMAWTSGDGLAWHSAAIEGEPAPSGPPQAFQGSGMTDVIGLAGGWLAVGSDIDIRTDGALQNAAMWTSRDGATWTRLPYEPIFQGGISAMAEFGAGIVTKRDGEVVVFGRTAGPTATLWFSPPRAGGSIPPPWPSEPPARPTPAPGQRATPAPAVGHPVGPVVENRLGDGRVIRASSSTADGPPSGAFDGLVDTTWQAAWPPPEWIEVDLGKNTSVAAIRLLPSQSPSVARTVHRIYGRADGEATEMLLRELDGITEDGSWISATFDPPRSVRYVRVETLAFHVQSVEPQAGPPWPAWREIEVVAAP